MLANGLNDCLPSREAYTNLGLGPAQDVPVNFTIGKQLCRRHNFPSMGGIHYMSQQMVCSGIVQ